MVSFISIFLLNLIMSCAPNATVDTQTNPYDKQLREYWYNGLAEISSYELKQARYGEMHDGKAVLIFVTEDFSTKTLTKADQKASENISVLKLNATRTFNTGIYPYSMMNSSFFPFPNGENSIKIATSSQEWCGHTYLELIDNGDFEIQNNSYFQSEAEKDIKLKKVILEDDLWTKIRLNPGTLPTGKMKVVPSFFYLRFSHNEIKAYDCELSMVLGKNGNNTYTITYPELQRELKITFDQNFPFQIQGWEDTYFSGWGEKKQKLTTSATLIKSMRIDYWTKNSNADIGLRGELGLE
ncbi:MAG: hypothetical protein ACJA08_002968 [Cyclobacteriaceae bacterium]|jgi:hypothetical protein